MSEYAQVSIGECLRQAREGRGLTLEEAAARLRLMHRQIEAMEADDFESLGQPVFARGFVRNYARLLDIPVDPLLAQMQGPAEPATVARAEAPIARSWLSSPWLMLMLLGLLLVVAVPVGLYLWLNSEPDEPVPSAPVVAQPRTAPAVAAASAPVSAPATAEARVPAIDTVLPSTETPMGTPAAGDAPVAPPVPPAAAPSEAPVAVPPATPASAPAPAAGALHLEFGADAWTEIRDAQQRTLHRQLNRAGSSIDVRGQAPFALVIGNAAQARLTYNGRVVDLKPHIDVTVARFTLDD